MPHQKDVLTLRMCNEITESFIPLVTIALTTGTDCIVPVPVEGMPLEVDLRHLFVGHPDSLGIVAPVNLGPNSQARLRRGRGDQADDGSETGKRLASPIHADVGE